MSSKSAAPKKTIAKQGPGGQLSLKGFFTPKTALTPQTESQPKAPPPGAEADDRQTPTKAEEEPAAASSQPEASLRTPVSLAPKAADEQQKKQQGAPVDKPSEEEAAESTTKHFPRFPSGCGRSLARLERSSPRDPVAWVHEGLT